jgi:hypothetical protein
VLADTFPDLTENQRRRFALKNVQALAAELEWLIRNNGSDDYFTQQLGTVTLSPPGADQFESKLNTSVKGVIDGSTLEEEEMPVYGLYTTQETGMGFIDLNPSVSWEWTARVDIRHQGPTSVTVGKEKYIPLEITSAANRLCRKFIHEAGLDARIQQEKDEDPNPV